MKKTNIVLFIIIILIGLFFIVAAIGCSEKQPIMSYTDQTVMIFNDLKSPVILIGKNGNTVFGDSLWSITVKDATGKVATFQNGSDLACTIGKSRNVGDTLK